MVLRPGADVYSKDGVAAKLTDIVVDPITHSVTHVVVTPAGEHQQARLVPLWLVNASKDGLRVELDNRFVKQLQRVLRTDFLRLPKTEIEGAMTVRFRTVLNHPYFEDPRPEEELKNSRGLARDDCPLHRGNDVISSNDRLLGQIVALLVHDDRIHGMVVRSGLVGFHNNVIVPTDSIAEVMADMVVLDIDRHQFRQLPVSSIVTVAKPTLDRKQHIDHLAASSWYTVRDFLVDLRR
jgi:sporulation protein YlmC with PRC-barrel domain